MKKRRVLHTQKDGCQVKQLIYTDRAIVVEQKQLPLKTANLYSWAMALGEGETWSVRDFTVVDSHFTRLYDVVPDCYLLVLQRLTPEGKVCGRLYVDMFLQVVVTATVA
jgi:hypothetical protein